MLSKQLSDCYDALNSIKRTKSIQAELDYQALLEEARMLETQIKEQGSYLRFINLNH